MNVRTTPFSGLLLLSSWLLLLAGISAAAATDKTTTQDDSDDVIIIPLGNIRSEGIHILPKEVNQIMGLVEDDNNNTNATRFALVSNVLWGSIQVIDLKNNEVVKTVVESKGYGARAALGMWYSNGAIFVCGAGSVFMEEELATFEPVLYVYNATTGEDITKCSPNGPAVFLNDVTVVGSKAYATDSFINSIMVLDVDAALKGGECNVQSIETPLDPFLSTNATINANGIIGYKDRGLFISHQHMGSIHYLDLTTQNTTEILSPGSTIFADGLAIGGGPSSDGSNQEEGADSTTTDILYVTENANRISAWSIIQPSSASTAAAVDKSSLEHDSSNASVLPKLRPTGYILSENFDTPTTCDVLGDNIYAVNARFGSVVFPHPMEGDLGTFNETFSVVGTNRFQLVGAMANNNVNGQDQKPEKQEEETMEEEEQQVEEEAEEATEEVPNVAVERNGNLRLPSAYDLGEEVSSGATTTSLSGLLAIAATVTFSVIWL